MKRRKREILFVRYYNVHISAASVCYNHFRTLALELSTLLEVTEAITIYIRASCSWPAEHTSVALGLKGT